MYLFEQPHKWAHTTRKTRSELESGIREFRKFTNGWNPWLYGHKKKKEDHKSYSSTARLCLACYDVI